MMQELMIDNGKLVYDSKSRASSHITDLDFF